MHKIKKIRWILTIPTALVLHCAQISKENLSNTTASDATSKPQPGVYLADSVVEAPGHTGTGFYDKAKAINGVQGAGTAAGSTTGVFSLDNTGASSHLVLEWVGKRVKNGAGIDFIVYENPFYSGGNSAQRFMDLAMVEVSDDNVNYCGFNPDYNNAPETTYTMNPASWLRLAGRNPVLYNQDSNNLGATELFQDNNADGEPDLGGGDAFNLDDLSNNNYYNTGCNTTVRDNLRTNGFRYLRLTPASRRINPDTGAVFVADGVSNGPDIDGAVARYLE